MGNNDVSRYYPSGELVRVGDRISINDVEGIVEEMLEPDTYKAEGYSCADTGGILYNTDKYGLMLISYGSKEGPVVKIR